MLQHNLDRIYFFLTPAFLFSISYIPIIIDSGIMHGKYWNTPIGDIGHSVPKLPESRTSLRDENLKLCTLTATNTRENSRWY